MKKDINSELVLTDLQSFRGRLVALIADVDKAIDNVERIKKMEQKDES